MSSACDSTTLAALDRAMVFFSRIHQAARATAATETGSANPVGSIEGTVALLDARSIPDGLARTAKYFRVVVYY